MTSFPMHEVYEMDGIAVHRLSPVYQQTRAVVHSSNHVPHMQPTVQWQPGIQVSPSSFDARIMSTAAPTRMYHQPSPQPQALYSTAAYHEQQPQPPLQPLPQPVLVIDPYSGPLFQDRVLKMDYIRKVLGVLFTQIGICFLIVNVFSLR